MPIATPPNLWKSAKQNGTIRLFERFKPCTTQYDCIWQSIQPLYSICKWTEQQVNFVCRLKKNAVYEVQETLFERELQDDKAGVLKEEHIHLNYKEGKQHKKLCLRKVTYRDDDGRMYEFITNNFETSREEVAYIYKLRWNIELLFKKLKQNFQLHYFYSKPKTESEPRYGVHW